VRVLVGRIDVMTPEQEAKIQELLATCIEAKKLSPEGAALLRTFDGRFLNPALSRAAKLRNAPKATTQTEYNTLRWQYLQRPETGGAARRRSIRRLRRRTLTLAPAPSRRYSGEREHVL
jgi:hypothetical protein